ncbi:MAG: TrmH family RNA methyltransferase [Planctomycetota bacterium]
MAANFEHLRHKPPTELARPRELVVALPAMQSNVNLSRIVRAASCFGVTKIVACGSGKVDRKIARDGADNVEISTHRSLPPVLKRFKSQGFRLVGLEQATGSQRIYDYEFQRQSVLVIGHERHGITEEELAVLDDVIEIPVHGMPFSHNAATSTVMAIYEYCRQFPDG